MKDNNEFEINNTTAEDNDITALHLDMNESSDADENVGVTYSEHPDADLNIQPSDTNAVDADDIDDIDDIDNIDNIDDVDDADGDIYKYSSSEKPAPAPHPSVARLIYSAYSEMRPAPGTRYAPLGIAGYSGLLLLTLIPVIGLLSAMILTLTAKRAAVQHFCAAVVILRTLFWVIAAVAIAIAVYLFRVDVFGLIFEYFSFVGNVS